MIGSTVKIEFGQKYKYILNTPLFYFFQSLESKGRRSSIILVHDVFISVRSKARVKNPKIARTIIKFGQLKVFIQNVKQFIIKNLLSENMVKRKGIREKGDIYVTVIVLSS